MGRIRFTWWSAQTWWVEEHVRLLYCSICYQEESCIRPFTPWILFNNELLRNTQIMHDLQIWVYISDCKLVCIVCRVTQLYIDLSIHGKANVKLNSHSQNYTCNCTYLSPGISSKLVSPVQLISSTWGETEHFFFHNILYPNCILTFFSAWVF